MRGREGGREGGREAGRQAGRQAGREAGRERQAGREAGRLLRLPHYRFAPKYPIVERVYTLAPKAPVLFISKGLGHS